MPQSQQSDASFRVFDPDEDVLVVERKLPHWAQPGTLCFITFRTWDSMPPAVLERWLNERRAWLERHGIKNSSHHAPRDAECDSSHHAPRDVRRKRNGQTRHAERDDYYRDWRAQFLQLDQRLQREFHETFSRRWHVELDNCHGECVLRQPDLSRIVANSLKHFDDDRYDLTDFVVMPNHVHLLAAFQDEQQMLDQCESWKHYTATKINRRLGRQGRFWQQDGFDHLVRSVEQFDYLRRYIAQNPAKANLPPGQFVHESKVLK